MKQRTYNPANWPSFEDRLIAKISPREDGCFEWVGSRDGPGYGQIWLRDRLVKAHRAMYELLVGPIPDGLELDHLCKNKWCVNPLHLEVVSHWQNVMRGDSLATRNAVRDRCNLGHLYDERNTRYLKNGARKCRRCHADRVNRDKKLRRARARGEIV